MSVTELTKVLLRAIEARGPNDAATRATVYDSARKAFARFLDEAGVQSEAERSRQNDEFEQIVERIEDHYGSGGRIPLSLTGETTSAVDDVSSPPAHPAPRRDRPSSPLQPRAEDEGPAAPVTGRGTRPAPLADDPPEATADAGAMETGAASDETAATAEGGDREDEGGRADGDEREDGLFAEIHRGGAGRAEAEEAGIDEHEIARRNRRGGIVLILLLLGMGFVYQTDLVPSLHRLIVGTTLPASVTEAPALVPAVEGSIAEIWPRTVSPAMAGPEADGTTAAFLWDESLGPISQGMPGRISWSSPNDGDPSSIGSMNTGTQSAVADFAFDAGDKPADVSGRLLMVRVPSLSARSSGTPVLFRVRPEDGRREEVANVAVRIGVDRFLFSLHLRSEDTAAAPDRRTVWQIAFPLDDERQVQLFFRLPASN